MRDLTVAIVSPYFHPQVGGVQRYAERIALEVRDTPGLRPVVITTAPGGRAVVETYEGVDIVRLPRWFTVSNTPFNPLWPWTVWRAFRRYGVDVVNTHSPVPGLADIAVCVAGARPVVQVYHSGSMVKRHGPFDRAITFYERRVLPRVLSRSAALIAVSRTSLAHAIPGSRIITPGVDTDVFTPAGPPTGLTVLYVGRVDRASAWKGVDVLIEAFAVVATEHPDAVLRIVGSGDAVADHQQLAHRLGVADRVDFAGELVNGDLVRAFQSSRMVVLPSLTESESFGMALVEAMACARPVIGSDIGGIPEVIENGSDGILVPPGDPRSLAAAIGRLLGDAALSAEMGARGRAKAEESYRWPVRLGAYVDIFRTLGRAGLLRR